MRKEYALLRECPLALRDGGSVRKNHVPLRECVEKACSLTLRNEEAEMKKIAGILLLGAVALWLYKVASARNRDADIG